MIVNAGINPLVYWSRIKELRRVDLKQQFSLKPARRLTMIKAHTPVGRAHVLRSPAVYRTCGSKLVKINSVIFNVPDNTCQFKSVEGGSTGMGSAVCPVSDQGHSGVLPEQGRVLHTTNFTAHQPTVIGILKV